MDRKFIGNNFHNIVLDIGEDYTLIQHSGEEYKGKLSMVAKTASTYMIGEREALMTGVATFPSIKEQTTFRGCYFTREIAQDKTYIMVSTIPKDTTDKVAEIYAIWCNTKVDLAYLVETEDAKHDKVTVPHVYQEDVPVYWDSNLQKQRRSSDGNFDQALYFIQIPAHYGLCQDEVVIRKTATRNEKTKKLEVVETRFRVEAIDMGLSSVGEDGTVYGIYDVQLSLDTRG